MQVDPIVLEMTVKSLEIDEGYTSCVILDSRGFFTVGHGILVDSRVPGCEGIPYDLSLEIMRRKAAAVYNHLAVNLPFWFNLSTQQRSVLVNMGYQLGTSGLLAFKKMLAALEKGDLQTVVAEMRDSAWHRQTPNRAEKMIKLMQQSTNSVQQNR
jgi:lysozyme